LNSSKEEDLIALPEIKIQEVKIKDSIVIIHQQVEISQFKIKEQVRM